MQTDCQNRAPILCQSKGTIGARFYQVNCLPDTVKCLLIISKLKSPNVSPLYLHFLNNWNLKKYKCFKMKKKKKKTQDCYTRIWFAVHHWQRRAAAGQITNDHYRILNTVTCLILMPFPSVCCNNPPIHKSNSFLIKLLLQSQLCWKQWTQLVGVTSTGSQISINDGRLTCCGSGHAHAADGMGALVHQSTSTRKTSDNSPSPHPHHHLHLLGYHETHHPSPYSNPQSL